MESLLSTPHLEARHQNSGAPARATIVIPTMCGSARATELRRSIASAINQIDIETEVVVVVNGNNCDLALLNEIEASSKVRVVRLAEPGISNARWQGLLHVRSEYFLMLDDDDELLPDAIRRLIAAFNRSPADTAIIVGDVYNTDMKGNYLSAEYCAEIERDPLESLTNRNWLILQSTLLRTAAIDSDCFNVDIASNECTVIAFRLALAGAKVRTLQERVATIYSTPVSESKTERYVVDGGHTVAQILKMNLPENIRHRLERKLSAMHHVSAEYFLNRGDIRRAWSYHHASLKSRGGWRYLTFTRHFLFSTAFRSKKGSKQAG